MAELLKNIYDDTFINNLGKAVMIHYPAFDQAAFTRRVFNETWQELELKDRMHRIAHGLAAGLPGDYLSSLDIILKVAETLQKSVGSGFEYMFLPDFVEQYGMEGEMENFDASVTALEELTLIGSAELAVRPFIIRYPKKMMSRMNRMAKHPSEHVRRLASEGCRPRLPWAMALPEFKQDPSPVMKIVKRLINDESLYVRRSVANNLNDISKDHPDVVMDIAEQRYGKNANIDWVIKHACRGLLKQAHPRALKLFGFGDTSHLTVSKLKLPKQVDLGSQMEFSFVIQTKKKSIGKLRIEYGIDFMKSNGRTSRKIFQISESTISATEKHISRKHSFKPISTRRHYPGKHGFSILLNGTEVANRSFLLAGQ